MTTRLSLVAFTSAALVACGHEVEPSDVKLVGVGHDPQSIGPEPRYYGGLVEYNFVDFAGGALTLGPLQLLATTEVGPALAGYAPPYKAVSGLSFLFDDLVADPAAHYAALGVPPGVPDTCWTNFEPLAYLATSTVDAGSALALVSTDGEVQYQFGRYPEQYPPDPQDVFVYYIGVETYASSPLVAFEGSDGLDPRSLEPRVVRSVNYAPGAEMELVFFGGLPPENAPVSSIPLPSRAVPNEPFKLPAEPSGLMLEWAGRLYDGTGAYVGDAGADAPARTCVQFLPGATPPAQPADCSQDADGDQQVDLPQPASDRSTFEGQIYTGPWDSPNQAVTFKWNPGSGEESVVLNLRFLGPVDRTDEGYLVGGVRVDPTSDVNGDWDDVVEETPLEGATGEVPQGWRPPEACLDVDSVEWHFDNTLVEGYGLESDPLKRHMRGDPYSKLVEVSCLLADDGEFTLTMAEHLADAWEYAQRKDAQGALFMFSRATEAEWVVPAVKDQADYRRETSPLQIRSSAVKMGRFWME